MRGFYFIIFLLLVLVVHHETAFSIEAGELKENANKFSNFHKVFRGLGMNSGLTVSEKCNPEVYVDQAIEEGLAKKIPLQESKSTEGTVCIDCGEINNSVEAKSEDILDVPKAVLPSKNADHCKTSAGKLLYNCKDKVNVRFAVDWLEKIPGFEKTDLAKEIQEFKDTLNKYNEAQFQFALDMYTLFPKRPSNWEELGIYPEEDDEAYGVENFILQSKKKLALIERKEGYCKKLDEDGYDDEAQDCYKNLNNTKMAYSDFKINLNQIETNKWLVESKKLESQLDQLNKKIQMSVESLTPLQFQSLMKEANRRTEQRLGMNQIFSDKSKRHWNVQSYEVSRYDSFSEASFEYPLCGAEKIEFQLVKFYVASGYDSINPIFWKSDKDPMKSPDATLLAYVMMNGLRGFPPYPGIVGRGSGKLPQDVMKEHKVGNTVLNKALTSTGRDGGWGYDNENAFVIFSREGRLLESINFSEKEVLFEPYHKFEVLSRKDNFTTKVTDEDGDLYKDTKNHFLMLDQGSAIGWDFISRDWEEFLKNKDLLEDYIREPER